MDVVGIEVGVALAILWRVAVETTNDTGQDTELFTSIVTDNANFDTDLGEVWVQLQRGEGHVLDFGGVEAQDAKVVDGIAVYGVDIALFVIVEDAVANKWSGANDVLELSVKSMDCA